MTTEGNREGSASVPSLCKAYEDKFIVAAAVNARTIQSQRDLLKTHYNGVTAENEMKFARVHPREDLYTFEDADRIAAFARDHAMKLRGHCLVWHNQTSDWVFEGKDGAPADRETLLARMREHIHTVVGRYKGQIYAWDVVNEAINDAGGEAMRPTKWLAQIGEDYIAKAFQFAHEADPDAQLFYNDYNESNPLKRDRIIALVKSLIDRGVPIHGIGLQAHWNIEEPPLGHIREAFERYAALGLRLHVTELDVSMFPSEDRRTDLTRPTAEMVERQQEKYEQIFGVFREYAEVLDAVTFWGAADDYTWLDNFPVRGRKNWPFLFDANQQPKQAFWQVVHHGA